MSDTSDEVLTGQVPVYPPCREHREVAHSDTGDRWCNQCGWTRQGRAERRGRPNGGFA